LKIASDLNGKDYHSAMLQSSIVVLPTRGEGWPNVFADAFYCRRLFLTTTGAKCGAAISDKTFYCSNSVTGLRRALKKITANIRAMGHTAADIHSNKSLSQRRAALEGFKSGRFRVLVATDIASRGIDVKNISLVVNYDLPDNSEDYVHRIGRTGRANESGKAVSFVTPEERPDVRQIERLIKKAIPVIALPVLPPRRAKVEVSRGESRPVGRRNFARMKKELHHPRRYSRQG